jgi:hypothetical protein
MPEPARGGCSLSANQFAEMYVHHLASEGIRHGISADGVSMATAVGGGVEWTVIARPFNPATVAPSDPPPVLPTIPYGPRRYDDLKPVDLAVMEAAPGPRDDPIPMTDLAPKAGYSYNHVRASVARLRAHRPPLIEKRAGGVRRLVDWLAG